MGAKSKLRADIVDVLSEKLKNSGAESDKLKKAIKKTSEKLSKKLAAFIEKQNKKISKSKRQPVVS